MFIVRRDGGRVAGDEKQEVREHNKPSYILTEIKGDKKPIGGRTDINYNFTTHKIGLQKGDSIYIFTDGYIDQFGGSDNKKFMKRRFKDLLLSIQDKSMDEQKEILNKNFEDWKSDREQIDDILVIGIRV
ncbi:MAG: SpoIIE family protein phosphatase [Bacteroidota bacterium]